MKASEKSGNIKIKELILVLISGGGSALLTYPIPPITLSEKSRLVYKLSKAGADISQLNKVRKCLSMVKGGKLASLARPAEMCSFILSDIIGDPLDLIASGPTEIQKQDAKEEINLEGAVYREYWMLLYDSPLVISRRLLSQFFHGHLVNIPMMLGTKTLEEEYTGSCLEDHFGI